jgi:isoquinoline 1-oxidoreductase beta subunit
MIYGLSAVLFGEITVKNGSVEQGNFDTYPVVRLKDAPKTEVHLALTGGKKWGGIGEPGAAIIISLLRRIIFAVPKHREFGCKPLRLLARPRDIGTKFA